MTSPDDQPTERLPRTGSADTAAPVPSPTAPKRTRSWRGGLASGLGVGAVLGLVVGLGGAALADGSEDLRTTSSETAPGSPAAAAPEDGEAAPTPPDGDAPAPGCGPGGRGVPGSPGDDDGPRDDEGPPRPEQAPDQQD